MNAGFNNLFSLKAQILAASMRAVTDYDQIITAIGLGVAAQFEKFCNRKFQWMTGWSDFLRSDRRHYYLSRYPVAALTALAKKDSEQNGWVPFPLPPDGSSLVQVMDLPRGYVNFIAIQGYFFSQLQITYSGGFFWEMLEPTDGGYPTTPPAGSTALPDDILFAWYLQCAHVWKQSDKLGVQIAQNPEGQTATKSIELVTSVKELLRPHIRYQMS